MRFLPRLSTLLFAGLWLNAVPGRLPAAAAAEPRPAADPQVRTLDNGLRVAFFPSSRLPIAEIVLLVPAGTAVADSEAAELAWPTAEMLSHGTTSRDPRAFAAAVEGLGGSFSSQATREHAVIAATFLARDFDRGIELVSDATLRPAFYGSELERVRRQAALSAGRLAQSPSGQAERRLWAEVFPGHPYGGPPFPDVTALRRLSVERVRAFHMRAFDPARSILVIGGDVEAEHVFATAKEWFGSWTRKAGAAAAAAREVPMPAAPRPHIVVVDRPNSDRAELRLGFRAPGRGDGDEPALALASSILADGPEPRRAALEGSESFAGGVRANRVTVGAAGLVSIGGNVPADSAAWAIERLRDALVDLSARAPSQEELETARRLERHAARLQTETLRDRLIRWGAGALQGLPAGFLEDAVAGLERAGADGVAAAARRWLDPTRATVVVVGPAETMTAALEALGEVEVFTADGSPLPRGLLPSAQPPAPEAVARARELVRLALAAHGGSAKLRGIKDSSIEAEIVLHMPGQQVSGRVRQTRKDPYRMQFMTWIGGVETQQALNGDRAWGINMVGDRTAFDLDALQVSALRDVYASDPPHLLLALAAADAQAVALGRERIDDRDVDVIGVTEGDGERWIAYLDAGTHRLAGIERREPQAAGAHLNRRLYRDYRPVGGIQWPHAEDRLRGGQLLMEMRFTEVTLNRGLDDALFEKPTALEPAPAR